MTLNLPIVTSGRMYMKLIIQPSTYMKRESLHIGKFLFERDLTEAKLKLFNYVVSCEPSASMDSQSTDQSQSSQSHSNVTQTTLADRSAVYFTNPKKRGAKKQVIVRFRKNQSGLFTRTRRTWRTVLFPSIEKFSSQTTLHHFALGWKTQFTTCQGWRTVTFTVCIKESITFFNELCIEISDNMLKDLGLERFI